MAPRELRFVPTKATFELGQQLGAGTVGVVYRATSPDLAHPVAVKLLHPSVSDDDKMVDRFEREISITERLDHPHIVQHYGGGKMDGRLFYAMQLLEHGTLKQRLRNHGSLDWPQAATFAVQIASALQHAHHHGIIHRDVKPSNLFFDSTGNLVLGDFGIARDTHASDITAQGVTVGTYSYMSPEQITADRHIDGRADIYSLGCVIFEMLTGQPPFSGANFAQVWDQHMHKPPPSVRGLGVDCPEWLDQLIRKLLSKQTDDRPSSAQAVEEMLREHLLDEFGKEGLQRLPEATKIPPAPAAGGSRVRPRMAAMVVTIGAIIFVLAISAWMNR